MNFFSAEIFLTIVLFTDVVKKKTVIQNYSKTFNVKQMLIFVKRPYGVFLFRKHLFNKIRIKTTITIGAFIIEIDIRDKRFFNNF